MRVAIAAVAGLAAVASTVGGTFAVDPGDPTTWPVAGTAVTDVKAVVGPNTDLFESDLQFTVQGLDCAAALATGDTPVLMYRTQTTGINGITGQPITQYADPYDPTSELQEVGPRGGDADQTLYPCDDGVGVVNPDGTMTVTTDPQHSLQMFVAPGKTQRNLPLYPNEQVNVRAEIVWAGGMMSDTIQEWHPVVMPQSPLWIGVGDGYTSAVNQTGNPCAWYASTTNANLSTTANKACINFNDKSSSWIQSAVDGVNSKMGVPFDWLIQPEVIASEPTLAADLASDTHTQITTMKARITARGSKSVTRAVTQPDGSTMNVTFRQPGSWNWIGLSAGLRDSGIIDALLANSLPTELRLTASPAGTSFATTDIRNTSGWYRSHGITSEGTTANTSTNPWSVAAGTTAQYPQRDCPRIENVPSLLVNASTGALTTRGASIRAGVENVYEEAKAAALASGSMVNVVQLEYPYFTELAAQPIGGYVSPCQGIVKSAVDALDNAASLASHSDVVRVNLRAALSNQPTGVVTVANNPATRDETAIQLRKPYGFPYLTKSGTSDVGTAVVGALYPRRPEVTYTYDISPVGEGAYGPDAWFNRTVTLTWQGTDPDSTQVWNYPPITLDQTDVNDEGAITLTSPQACKTSPTTGAQICSDVYDVTVYTDFTAPQAHVAVTDAATGAPMTATVIDGKAWYGKKVKLDWVIDGDLHPTDPDGAVSDIDPDVPLPPTVTVNEGADQTFWNGLSTQPAQATTICDRAANCRLVAANVSVDLTAPTLSLHPSANVLVHDNGDGTYSVAYNPDLFPDDPLTLTWLASDGAGSGVASQPPVITVDNLTGIKTYTSPPVCDRVGNCTPVPKILVEADYNAAAAPTISGHTLLQPNAAGWFNTNVVVVWDIAAAPNAVVNAPALITAEGAASSVTGTVTDAGGTASDIVTVKLDKTAPVVTGVTGLTDGKVYTYGNGPVLGTLTCTATETLSGLAGCSVTAVGAPVPVTTSIYEMPGLKYTVAAVATDVAGNVSAPKLFTYTVQGAGLETGRITGSSTTPSAYGNVSASFTLRCDGSPNQLVLKIGNSTVFTLDRVLTTTEPSSSTGYASWCWSAASATSPHAPIDSLRMLGEGHLANGTKVLIDFSLLDRNEGNRCSIADQARFTVRSLTGAVLLSSEGRITKGNIQAHAATGNGSNANGNVNGPTGHTSHSSTNDRYQQERAKRQQAPSTTSTTVAEQRKSNRNKSHKH